MRKDREESLYSALKALEELSVWNSGEFWGHNTFYYSDRVFGRLKRPLPRSPPISDSTANTNASWSRAHRANTTLAHMAPIARDRDARQTSQRAMPRESTPPVNGVGKISVVSPEFPEFQATSPCKQSPEKSFRRFWTGTNLQSHADAPNCNAVLWPIPKTFHGSLSRPATNAIG